jgi:hypothetical protein
MRKIQVLAASLAVSILSFAHDASAAEAKTYQVTGPVLEVTDTMIAVQKGKDRWEVARDASTKITGDLKVGSKVTIEYRMHATTVEVKSAAPAKSTTKKKAA